MNSCTALALAVLVLVASLVIYWVMTRKKEGFSNPQYIVYITDYEYPKSPYSTGDSTAITADALDQKIEYPLLQLDRLDKTRRYIAIAKGYQVIYFPANKAIKAIKGLGMQKFVQLPSDFSSSSEIVVTAKSITQRITNVMKAAKVALQNGVKIITKKKKK